MDYQISPLILNPTKSATKTGLYISPNNLVQQSNLGLLVIVVEIASREKSTKKIIDQIINDLSSEYYQSATSNTESALETTCQKFNETILTSSGKDKKWFIKLNLMIAAFKDNDVVMSNFGKMSVLLFRKNKIVNILENQDDEKNTKNKSFKIFNQVIYGNLQDEDIVVMTNPSLLDYFSHEKIKKTCQSLSPLKATEVFKGLLADNLTPTSFGSAILKTNTPKTPEETAIKNLSDELSNLYGPQVSMDQLSSLERKTSKLLTASLWPNTKKAIDKIFTPFGKIFSFHKRHRLYMPPKPTLTAKEDTKKPKQESASQGSKIHFPSTIFARISSFFTTILDSLARLRPAKKASQKTLKPLGPQKSLESHHGLSKTGRVYLFITVVLVLAFALSIFIINNNKTQQKKQAAFEEQISYINDKTNAAEAALIYQDEEKAQKLLQEARTALNQIVDTTTKLSQNQSRQIELTNQSIQTITLKIHHLTQLNTLESIANFSTLPDKNEDFILNTLSISNQQIYVTDNQNNLYLIDPRSKSFTPIDQISFSDQTIRNINFFNQDNLILETDQANFFNFNLKTKILNRLEIGLREDSQVAGWQIYSENLYLIDYINNQIYKFPKQGNEFTPRSAWLKDSSLKLDQNTSIIIDGNIWLNSDNQLVKLFKGSRQDFTISGLEKDLGSDFRFYTNSDINYIFILDNYNNKIIVLDKPTGRVNQQFIYPSDYNLRDISSSPDGKTIYLLGQKKIFKLDF